MPMFKLDSSPTIPKFDIAPVLEANNNLGKAFANLSNPLEEYQTQLIAADKAKQDRLYNEAVTNIYAAKDLNELNNIVMTPGALAEKGLKAETANKALATFNTQYNALGERSKIANEIEAADRANFTRSLLPDAMRFASQAGTQNFANWLDTYNKARPQEQWLDPNKFDSNMLTSIFDKDLTNEREDQKLKSTLLTNAAQAAASNASARASGLSAQRAQMEIDANKGLLVLGGKYANTDFVQPVVPITLGTTTVPPEVLLDPTSPLPAGVTEEQLKTARSNLTLPKSLAQTKAEVTQELYAKGIPPSQHAPILQMVEDRYKNDPDVIQAKRETDALEAANTTEQAQRQTYYDAKLKEIESKNSLATMKNLQDTYKDAKSLYSFVEQKAPNTSWYGSWNPLNQDTLGGFDLRKSIKEQLDAGVPEWIVGAALEASYDVDTFGMNPGIREMTFKKYIKDLPEVFKREQEAAATNLQIGKATHTKSSAELEAETKRTTREQAAKAMLKRGLLPNP